MPARKKTRKASTKKTKTRRRARSTARKSAGMARNPTKRKSAKKAAPKTMSKKVGRWRVEVKGRSVYAAGAKHAYASAEVARAVYKKLTSIKSVEAFVRRYGTKKTQAAVLGLTKRPTKKAAKKRAPAKKKATKRNAPITKSEQQAISRMLRRHGYRVR